MSSSFKDANHAKEVNNSEMQTVLSRFVDARNAENKDKKNLIDKNTFSTLLQEHLSRLQLNNRPHQILLHTYNLNDGIGDFRHNIDFSRYYKKVTGDSDSIKLHSLCFVTEEKMPLTKFFLEDELKKDDVYYFNPKTEKFNAEKAKKCDYVICTYSPTLSGHPTVLAKSDPDFLHYIQQHQTMMGVSQNAGIEVLGNSECYQQFISEYSYSNTSMSNYQTGNDSTYNSAYTMGVGDSIPDVGIKFYDSIFIPAQTVLNDKASFLLKQNHELQKRFLGNQSKIDQKSVTEYFNEHNVGFGYLQDEDSFIKFVLTAVASSNKPGVDLFTNSNFFANTAALISKKNSELQTLLKKAGIGSIQFKLKSGEINTITISDEKNAKQLRLLDSTGIPEADKEKLLVLSDTVGGSGDSSYSETFSACNNIPYFSKKKDFFTRVVENITRGNFAPPLDILQNYMKFFSGESQTTNTKYFDFVLKNHDQILKEFQIFSKHLYQNYNVAHAQNNMLIQSLITSVLTNGSHNEIVRLLNAIPNWQLDQKNMYDNFVLFAAKRKPSLFRELFTVNSAQFTEQLDRAILKNPKIAEELFSNPESIKLLNENASIAKCVSRIVMNRCASSLTDLLELKGGAILFINTCRASIENNNTTVVESLLKHQIDFSPTDINVIKNCLSKKWDEICNKLCQSVNDIGPQANQHLKFIHATLNGQNIFGKILRSTPDYDRITQKLINSRNHINQNSNTADEKKQSKHANKLFQRIHESKKANSLAKTHPHPPASMPQKK